MKPHGFHPPGEGFCEIGAASNFSFLRGASTPEEMVVSASLMGLGGLGLADRNTLSGVVRAYAQARSETMAFRPGARLVFCDGTPDILAYPRNREGWGHLCRLLSLGNLRTVKGDCRLALPDLLERGAGLNLALLPDDALGQPGPEAEEAQGQARDALQALFAAFGRSVRLALAFRYDGLDERRLARASHLAAACRTPLLATNDAFYHSPERRRMQDVVTAIREHVRVGEAGLLLSRNAERRLKGSAEMARLFRRHPGAVEEAGRFFGELGFDLKSLAYEYPDEGLALGEAPVERLRRLARQGAATRYPGGVPQTVLAQIETELGIIERKGYEPYFLTVHRIVEAARGMGILCQGRGSAANSVVCFAIGVTEVDPGRAGLLFDRFISEERDEPPDIDIDFEHERRDEVIRWIYETYGHQSAAIAATVISYRSRSSLREVGKAFGLSEDALSALSGTVWGTSHETPGEREAKAAGLSTGDPTVGQVLRFAAELSGFPRHLSQHVGGFVLTRGRIDELVPVLNTGAKGRTIVEWDKDDLDELGILKVDVLALGMLSCLRRAFEFLKAHYPDALPRLSEDKATMALIEDGDDDTYEMTHRADTLGVFQIESRAQMTMLPKLKPREFYDLVIQVAIVRPGPIQGDMVHPYLRRRMGLEDPVYPKPELEEILKRTYGVPLFQEQAMRIAMVAAEFTGAEADKLRRAMATFKRTGEVGNFRERFIAGMKNNGYEEDFAERCFKQIEGFGEYGFPESHAASFALIVYASCWLKCHYPDVFCASLLNAQPMGFYAPAQIVRDAREHGIEVRPVAINSSRWDSTLEAAPPFDPRAIVPRHRAMAKAIRSERAVRLGFRQVKGLSEHEIRRTVWVRDTSGPFDSVRDLWLRSGLHRDAIERLADADAFAGIGLSRREALWACRALDAGSAAETLPLFMTAAREDLQAEPDAGLPPMPLGEEVINDYRFLSLSLKAHPVSFVRGELGAQRVLPNMRLEALRSGARVCVSGLVLVRQRPGSAKGVIFITVEDETGVANVIVWPKVFERFRPLVLGARFIKVTGRMQSDHGVIHVVAERIEDLTHLLMQVAAGDAFSGAIAPADHVRHPLRPGHPRRQAPAALPVEGALGAMLAHADEVRRPIDETRRSGQYRDRIRRLAIEASRVDAVQQAPANEPDLRAVLPKGRNFQ